MSTSGNDRIVFIHVPKTGGGWVTEAMKAAGIQQERIGPEHHPGKAEIELHGRFAFGFVREPLSWYGSVWNFRRRIWREKVADPDLEIPEPELPNEWLAQSFPEFLEKVLADRSGFLTGYYERFVGSADDPIDFIGHFETMADDLVRALTMAGETFDEEALRAFPAVNTTGPIPSCASELRERIQLAEAGTYERFYAGAIPSQP